MAWYGEQDARCPFFRRREKKMIVCEGLVDESRIILSYSRSNDYQIQYSMFCCKNYEKCEIYRLLMDKYQD